MISAALVTQAARWSRMSALQPADVVEVTGPGTAISGRARSLARRRSVVRRLAHLGRSWRPGLDGSNPQVIATGQDGGAADVAVSAP